MNEARLANVAGNLRLAANRLRFAAMYRQELMEAKEAI
jgi:hypothetical protein